MFIGACAQINVHENVFVCVPAFVLKTYFIEQDTCTFTEKSLLVSSCHGIY